VPEPAKPAVPTTDPGCCRQIVEPGTARLTSDRPDATRSGLAQPSGEVGPAALKSFISSSDGSGVPLSSRAPTVTTNGSSAGDRIVPLNGPLFPAETTTVIPWFQTACTAWSSGSRTEENVGR